MHLCVNMFPTMQRVSLLCDLFYAFTRKMPAIIAVHLRLLFLINACIPTALGTSKHQGHCTFFGCSIILICANETIMHAAQDDQVRMMILLVPI